jgi:hypothetical protein
MPVIPVIIGIGVQAFLTAQLGIGDELIRRV